MGVSLVGVEDENGLDPSRRYLNLGRCFSTGSSLEQKCGCLGNRIQGPIELSLLTMKERISVPTIVPS